MFPLFQTEKLSYDKALQGWTSFSKGENVILSTTGTANYRNMYFYQIYVRCQTEDVS